jgi:hypothetical protein
MCVHFGEKKRGLPARAPLTVDIIVYVPVLLHISQCVVTRVTVVHKRMDSPGSSDKSPLYWWPCAKRRRLSTSSTESVTSSGRTEPERCVFIMRIKVLYDEHLRDMVLRTYISGPIVNADTDFHKCIIGMFDDMNKTIGKHGKQLLELDISMHEEGLSHRNIYTDTGGGEVRLIVTSPDANYPAVVGNARYPIVEYVTRLLRVESRRGQASDHMNSLYKKLFKERNTVPFLAHVTFGGYNGWRTSTAVFGTFVLETDPSSENADPLVYPPMTQDSSP